MIMKRKIILMLLLLLGVGQLIRAIQVRLPNLAGVAGDTLTVPLYVDDDLFGKNVVAYQFDISYNSSAIKLLEVTTAGTLSSGFNELSVKNNTDYFTIAGAGSIPLTGKGVLLNIKIVLIAYGTYIQFRNGTTDNYFNEGTPDLSFTYGYISIADKPVISVDPMSLVLNVGDIQQFNTWGGTPPYFWSVSDNSIASIDASGKLTVSKSGMVNVFSTDSKGYRGVSGVIDCRSFRATIPDTTFYQNNFIDIPVNLTNLDQSDLYSGKFAFTYNESILSFESLITTNSILGGSADVEYSKQAGKTTISFALSSGVISSGLLFKLRFRIADLSGGGTSVSFDEATINESLLPKCRNGYFNIQSLSTLYVSSSGSTEMYAGDKNQFYVSGGFPPYTWEVENTSLAVIGSSGELTAKSGGSTRVLVKDIYGAMGVSVITVYDSWMNVRDTSVVVNHFVLELPVDLGALPVNKGIISFSGKVSCLSTKIDSIQVINSGTLTQNWQLACKTGQNQANFAVSGVVPILSGGKIIYIKIYFNHSLMSGDIFNIDCTDLVVNEGTPFVKTNSGSVSISDLSTGLEGLMALPASLYPIPASDQLFIRLNPDFTSSVISILDLSGKIFLTTTLTDFTGSQYELPIKSIDKGCYFLKLQTQRQNVLLKFIKR